MQSINSKMEFKSLHYLATCDFINKYSLKTSYDTVKLNRIKISFPLRKFIKTFEAKQKKLMQLYKIPYLVLYLYFSNVLKMKYNPTGKEYTLEIIITNLKQIKQFLFLIFIENQNCFYNFNGVPKVTQFQKNNKLSYTYKFSSLLLSGLQELVGFFFPTINLKRFFMYINFFFNTTKKLNGYGAVLKNLPFFCVMNFKE
jgi:hypothetical protein